MRVKTLPIFLAFFLMGLADAMGPMSDSVKKQYERSNLVAALLPFFVFIAFAVFSLQAGSWPRGQERRNCSIGQSLYYAGFSSMMAIPQF